MPRKKIKGENLHNLHSQETLNFFSDCSELSLNLCLRQFSKSWRWMTLQWQYSWLDKTPIYCYWNPTQRLGRGTKHINFLFPPFNSQQISIWIIFLHESLRGNYILPGSRHEIFHLPNTAILQEQGTIISPHMISACCNIIIIVFSWLLVYSPVYWLESPCFQVFIPHHHPLTKPVIFDTYCQHWKLLLVASSH